jgi:GNAT superfamily N-acetyltransferase
MNIIPLNLTNQHHTQVVLSLVVQSTLDYGDLDTDARLLAWQHHQGQWIVAANDEGDIIGIACVVGLSDGKGNSLLWVEATPPYQHQGIEHELLTWMQQHNTHKKNSPYACQHAYE